MNNESLIANATFVMLRTRTQFTPHQQGGQPTLLRSAHRLAGSLPRRSRSAQRWIRRHLHSHSKLCSLITLTLTLTFTLGAAEPYAESIQRLQPMGLSGLEPGLTNVLRNYYKNTFTDAVTWSRIESIRFDGALHLPQGVLRFTAFKKKPDYTKVVIFAPNGGRVVMAYDGQDAWQLNTLQSSRADWSGYAESLRDQPVAAPSSLPLVAPSIPRSDNTTPPEEQSASTHHSSGVIHHSSAIPMPPAEALNFIRDATTGGHLLYPEIEGKTIELLGVAMVDGQRLYDLQVTLPDGQVIRSFLDPTSFLEVRQVTTNHLSGDEEVLTHSDFRTINGVRIPFTTTRSVDGQQVHQSRLYTVQTNLGVMPWMFSRPSGDYLPGRNGDYLTAPRPMQSPNALDAAIDSGGSPSRPFTSESFLHIDPQQADELEAILRAAGVPAPSSP